jgi:acyl dehydratase
MRLHVETSGDTATQAGVGVDTFRRHQPLRPGDTFRLRTEIIDKRPSESSPERRFVTTRNEGLIRIIVAMYRDAPTPGSALSGNNLQ